MPADGLELAFDTFEIRLLIYYGLDLLCLLTKSEYL